MSDINGLQYYEYKASLLKYFYTPMAPYESLFSRKIRETLDFIKGKYKVLYIFEKDSPIAYCTIVRGGGRYKFSTKNDIVVCNVWVRPENRGKGIAAELYKFLLNNMGIQYSCAYAFIPNDNLPSIKTALNVGFKKTADADRVGLMKNIKVINNGHLGIWEYRPSC